jgi:hypothetical protein
MPNFFLSYKRAGVAGGLRVQRAMTGYLAPNLKQTRRDPAQGPPDSAMKLLPGPRGENAPGRGALQERWAMKLFTGWVMSAGLVFAAGAANAQMPAPYEIGSPRYTVVSDVGGPYGAVPYGGGPYAAMPPEASGPGYGPTLLPPLEVYTILRENGFSPLGIPHQRGLFYIIAVIDRRGDDGRMVIDARTGRIIRFMPAYRMGDNFNEDMTGSYGPAGPLPPISNMRGAPRPPAPVPQMASRTPPVPLPKASPPHAGEITPLAAKPTVEKPAIEKPALEKSADKPAIDKPAADKPAVAEPAQQSAAAQAGPADRPAHPQAAVPIVEAKPTAPIQPTQEMPKVQGLE